MITLASVASTWLAAGNANAAQDLATLSASDNRFGLIFLLFAPVLGWAAYNILQPALGQLDKMSSRSGASVVKKARAALKKRGVAAGVGLGAAFSLLLAERASAANEVAQLAADNRSGIIFLLFVPVLGWAAFNILQPALGQLDKMSSRSGASVVKKARAALKKRGVAAGVGLGAAFSLLFAERASAANEVAQLAADNRFGIILLLFVPVVGWSCSTSCSRRWGS